MNINPDHCVYLDVETTGLEADHDEVVAIAIVDHAGNALIDTLVRPERRTSWSDAEEIHGIGPDHVATAPMLAELGPAIGEAVRDRHVVMYNEDFDLDFVGHLLAGKAGSHCCMYAWSKYADVRSEPWRDCELWTLDVAAAEVEFEWSAPRNSALGDALASRAIWRYLYDPETRAAVDARRKARQREREDAWAVEHALEAVRWAGIHRDRARAEHTTRFLERWWLRRGVAGHWTAKVRDRTKIENLYAQLFYGASTKGLMLLDRFETVYRRQRDIPDHLKPASFWFDHGAWFREELRPTAAYVGRVRAWPLYDVAEEQRLKRKFRLRFASVPPDTGLHVSGSRSWLRKLGYTNGQIDRLPVVAERYNCISHIWYPVYRAPR